MRKKKKKNQSVCRFCFFDKCSFSIQCQLFMVVNNHGTNIFSEKSWMLPVIPTVVFYSDGCRGFYETWKTYSCFALGLYGFGLHYSFVPRFRLSCNRCIGHLQELLSYCDGQLSFYYYYYFFFINFLLQCFYIVDIRNSKAKGKHADTLLKTSQIH